jgi:hypothetical protein
VGYILSNVWNMWTVSLDIPRWWLGKGPVEGRFQVGMLLKSYCKPTYIENFAAGFARKPVNLSGGGWGVDYPPGILFGFGVKILLEFRVFQYFQVVQSEFYSNYGGIYSTA